MLWSKSFIMERERYDGADVAHLLRAPRRALDWKRLLDRFGGYWRVLLQPPGAVRLHLPGRARSHPGVGDGDADRAPRAETCARRRPDDGLCQGTILSRQQYLPDVERWGYHDARVFPRGHMSADDTATWTAAIGDDK